MTHPVDRRFPPFRTTGQLALLLEVTEPKLSELVRRGHIQPPPTIVSGRRLWNRDQVRQAAEVLGIKLSANLREQSEGSDE